MNSNDRIASYLVAGLVGALMGILGMNYLDRMAYIPKEAYTQELNEDNKLDLVAESSFGRKIILLNQGDGKYKILDDISKEQIKSIESEHKSIENKVMNEK